MEHDFRSPIVHPDLKTKLSLIRLRQRPNLSPESRESIQEELSTALGLVENNSHNKLRQLMASGAPWSVISEKLWTEFTAHPNAEKASLILETAFVLTTQDETLQIFSKFLTSQVKDFYWHLHHKLRDFFVENVTGTNANQLFWIMARSQHESKLSAAELAFLYLNLLHSSDRATTWSFFSRYHDKIISLWDTGTRFHLSPSQFLLKTGELALASGHFHEARELFKIFPLEPDMVQKVVALYKSYESENTVDSHSELLVQMRSLPSWQSRMELLGQHIYHFRSLGPIHDRNGQAINIILKNILNYLPKAREAWSMAAEFLVQHRDLQSSLPELMSTFATNAPVFHEPEFETALWSPAAQISPRDENDKKLLATALLHLYVGGGTISESSFWHGVKLFKSISDQNPIEPWQLATIVKSAEIKLLQRPKNLLERDHQRILASINLAIAGPDASKECLENYLTYSRYIPEGLVLAIAHKLTQRQQFDEAISLLIRSALNRRLINSDINGIWHIACKQSDSDLAWRAATVLGTRNSLSSSLRHGWEISGERRSSYTPVQLTIQDMETALSEFSPPIKRLLTSICTLGQKINELVALQSNSQSLLPPMNGTSTIEQAIVNAVKNTAAIAKPCKAIVDTKGIQLIPSSSLSLSLAIINNPWLFAVRLVAERLSLPSWAWNVKHLRAHVKEVTPYIGTNSSQKLPPKIARWVSGLTSQDRAAWIDISKSAVNETDDTVNDELLKFICRLATILYPAHFQALKTLQELAVPLEILGDLERFILSDGMTQVRRRHNITTRVNVPESLRHDQASNFGPLEGQF